MTVNEPAFLPPAPRSERTQLRELLAGRATARLQLPEELEQLYGAYHHTVALGHLRSYWPLVVGAVTLICIVTFMSGIVTEEMRLLTAFGFFVMFTVIGMVVAGAVVPVLQPHITRFVGMATFIGLLAMHIATLLHDNDSPLHAMAEYGVVFVTVAAFSISNLPFRVAVFATLTALGGLLVVTLATGLTPDWQHFWFYAVGSLLIGAIIGFAQEIRERTVFLQERLLALEKDELDALTRELALISRKDALTGLANRRHFDEVLAREWAACQREGVALNLAFIDVDYFKRYNDHYGHLVGDDCLRQIGRALATQALRGADFVARYGGEEFVALFPRTSREGLEIIARRIIDAIDGLQLPHAGSTVAPTVSVSVGVASVTPGHDDTPERLIRLADEAVYRAKGNGRHQYVAAWKNEA